MASCGIRLASIPPSTPVTETIGRNISNANSITGYATDATADLTYGLDLHPRLRAAPSPILPTPCHVRSDPRHRAGPERVRRRSSATISPILAMTNTVYRHGFELSKAGPFTDISARTRANLDVDRRARDQRFWRHRGLERSMSHDWRYAGLCRNRRREELLHRSQRRRTTTRPISRTSTTQAWSPVSSSASTAIITRSSSIPRATPSPTSRLRRA